MAMAPTIPKSERIARTRIRPVMPASVQVSPVAAAIDVLDGWAVAIDARSLRRIRRTELVAIREDSLARLAELRFQAPAGSDFRSLMSNVAFVASRETRDPMLEQWLRAFSRFLGKQLRARDPFNWHGESLSVLYGLELSLPRKEWPYAFTDR